MSRLVRLWPSLFFWVLACSALSVAALPVPQDLEYPGVIELRIDTTDLAHRVFRAEERLPVAHSGPLTLLYPKWLPGRHSIAGPIDKLAGLIIQGNGREVAWRRDSIEPFAFHVDVPAGVKTLDIELEYLSPLKEEQGAVMITNEMLNLQWNQMALYPAGYFASRIRVKASVRLPKGWEFATALDAAAELDGLTSFGTVSFETLVDSPLYAGLYFKRLNLDPGGTERVTLNVVADAPAMLKFTEAQLRAHRGLIEQSDRLFGARHYDHYDFLMALTDRLGGLGYEHQRSSESEPGSDYFTSWDAGASGRDLIAHEFLHSWNGKYRRPMDLWTPDFNTPMQGSLLWMYEGLTQYWGFVISARAGMLSRQDVLDSLAQTAANLQVSPGRQWRSLQDTTNNPAMRVRSPPWSSWSRAQDFYAEAELLWLDVDTMIREQSGGKRSLDDFARAFFGTHNGEWTPATYTIDDIMVALNQILPYDWKKYWRYHLDGHGLPVPLDGLLRGGYQLVFTETPSHPTELAEAAGGLRLAYSLGMNLAGDGAVGSVLWEGPAYRAGLLSGMKIVTVNGDQYNAAAMRRALASAKLAAAPIRFSVKFDDEERQVLLNYHGGQRYPRLTRVAGTPARLDDILKPLAK